MTIVAPRAVNVLGSGGAAVSTIFRDSFNRSPQVIGANWIVGTKPNTAAAGNIVTATAFLGNPNIAGQCATVGLSTWQWSHTAPTFNPTFSWNAWALALPTATSNINGASQFASVKLCFTTRVGVSGDLFAGPAVLINLSAPDAGQGYTLNVRATTHGWSLDKTPSANLASGAGISDGDILSLEATVGVGNVTLVARRNSTILTTQVDNTPYTIGYPGMFCQAIQQNPGVLVSEWANYIGGLGALQVF